MVLLLLRQPGAWAGAIAFPSLQHHNQLKPLGFAVIDCDLM